METATEHCDKCGVIIYAFSMDVAISDNSSYCIKCAEELDRHYLANNVCTLCTRLLDKNDIKVVMPSRLYSSYFFEKLPIGNRLMCITCFRRVEKLNIIKQPLTKIEQIRIRLKKSFVRKSTVRAESSE